MALTWNTQTVPIGNSQTTPEELRQWLITNTAFGEYADITQAAETSEGAVWLWYKLGSVYVTLEFYGTFHTGSSSSTLGIATSLPKLAAETFTSSWANSRVDSTTIPLSISEAETSKYLFAKIGRETADDTPSSYYMFVVFDKQGRFAWVRNSNSPGTGAYYTYFAFPDGLYADYANKYKSNVQARNDASTYTNKRIVQKLYLRGNDYGIWSLDGNSTANNLGVRTEFSANGKNFIQIGAGLALEL